MGEMNIGEAMKELYSCGAMVEEPSGGSMKDLNSAVRVKVGGVNISQESFLIHVKQYFENRKKMRLEQVSI